MSDRAELADVGYVVVPALDDAALQRLWDALDAAELDLEHPFFASCHELPPESRRPVHDRLVTVARLLRHPLLEDHEPFLTSFIVKGARVGARCDLHQDLTYTDERSSRALLTWAPLVDTDASNGGMEVIPGSHRWSSGIRPGTRAELPTAALLDRLEPMAVEVPVHAGEVLVYDPALIHGSAPNRSDGVRPVLAAAFARRGAPLVHFHSAGSGALEGFLVDDSFALEQSLFDRADGYPTYEAWAPAVTSDELAVAAGLTTAARPRSAALRRRWRERRTLRR